MEIRFQNMYKCTRFEKNNSPQSTHNTADAAILDTLFINLIQNKIFQCILHYLDMNHRS